MTMAVLDRASQPIRNVVPSPASAPGVSVQWSSQTPAGSTVSREQIGPNGDWTIRVLPIAANQLRIGWKGSSPTVPAQGGSTWTTGFWVWGSKALTGCTVETQWYDVDNVATFVKSVQTFTIQLGWQWIVVIYTAPASAVKFGLQQLVSGVGQNAVAGDEFRATRAITTAGAIPDLTPFDGDSPNWRWTGTPGASESVGYPLPPNIVPDSYGMTGWSGGTNFGRYAYNDPLVTVAGCPYAYCARVGVYDTRITDTTKWPASNIGEQSWVIEGWAAADPAVGSGGTGGNHLRFGMRWGSAYANSTNGIPNGYYASPYSSVLPGFTQPTLDPTLFRTWTRFKRVVRFAVPVGTTPNVTPNFGVDGSVSGWFMAGVTIRRALVGETEATFHSTLESVAGAPAFDLGPNGVDRITDATTTSGRTIYAVYDVTGWALFTLLRFGSDQANLDRARLASITATGQARPEYFNASNVQSNPIATVPLTSGRHVAAYRVGGGIVSSGMVDGEFVTFNPTVNLTNNQAWAYSSTEFSMVPSGARAPVYGVAHSDATMKSITAYLARKYGAPIPAGY